MNAPAVIRPWLVLVPGVQAGIPTMSMTREEAREGARLFLGLPELPPGSIAVPVAGQRGAA